MNGRFEKLIAAAVLAGAIGLTGCASSGGGNGNGTKDDGGGGGDTPENVAPELVSARTLDSTHLELIFSEPVDVGDTSAAAEMFALNASFRVSKLNYIDAAGTTCHSSPPTLALGSVAPLQARIPSRTTQSPCRVSPFPRTNRTR